MKIIDVKATPPLGAANRNWSVLKVVTDEGLVGVGECVGGNPAALRELLVGRDPTNVNAIHHESLWRMHGRGSGVEIALWDIAAKARGVPLHALLGGKLRDRVRIYCDCHGGVHWTPEEYGQRWREVRRTGELDPVYGPDGYAAQARAVVDEGFTAVKFDLDVANPWKLDVHDGSISRREHEHIVTVIERLRQEVGPYVDLAVDLHGSFHAADALRVCKDVEHLDLLWLEDPIRWERGSVDVLAKLCRQTETPICTGEIFYGAPMFRELMEKQACDLIEPDIPKSGGPIEIRRIAELAQLYHMSMAPHYMASPVTGMAAVHLCATIPNVLALEHHSRNIPLWSQMLDCGNPIRDGYIEVPDGPGLGVELNEDALAAQLPDGAALWT